MGTVDSRTLNLALTTESESLSMTNTASSGLDSVSKDRAVRTVKLSEYREAAQCLAEAFRDDDVANYFVRTGERKKRSDQQYWKLHVYILECLVRAHIMKGLVTTIGPGYDCVALWLVLQSSR